MQSPPPPPPRQASPPPRHASPLLEIISRAELGNVGIILEALPPRALLSARELDEAHTVAVSAGAGKCHAKLHGLVVAWGRSDEFQLGQARDIQALPRRLTSLAIPVVQIATSAYHTLARTVDGVVLAWGTNKFGRLGTGDELLRAAPTRIFLGEDGDVDEAAIFVATGTDTSVIVTASNSAYTCGRNNHLQLGLGEAFAQSFRPRKVHHTSRFVSAACSPSHTLLLDDAGAVYAAGADDRGQCRAQGGTRGKPLKRFTLVPVEGVMAGIAACEGMSASWTRGGEGIVWGQSRPVRLKLPMQKVRKVALSSAVVAVVTEDGSLWTRGSRAELLGHSEPGQERKAHLSALKKVDSLSGIVDVSCGERHVAAVDNQGRVWAWGEGEGVALPQGYRPQPAVVDGVRGAVAITAGLAHTAVIIGSRAPNIPENSIAGNSLLDIAQRQAVASLDVFNAVSVMAAASRLGLEELRELCETFLRANFDVLLALNPAHARFFPLIFPGDPELDEATIVRCTSPVFRGSLSKTASPVHSRAVSPIFNKSSSPQLPPGFSLPPASAIVGPQRPPPASQVDESFSLVCSPPPLGVSVATSTPIATTKNQSSKPSLSSGASRSTLEEPASSPQQRWVGRCDVCGVVFNDASSRASHLLGRRHKAAVHRKLHDSAWAPPEATPPAVGLREVMREHEMEKRPEPPKNSPLPSRANWASPPPPNGSYFLVSGVLSPKATTTITTTTTTTPPPPQSSPSPSFSLRQIQQEEEKMRKGAQSQPLPMSVWGLIAPKQTSFADVQREQLRGGHS